MIRGRNKPKRALITLAVFGIASLSVLVAVAQSYPDRPIRLVVPFSAGGPNGLIGRPLTEVGGMSPRLACAGACRKGGYGLSHAGNGVIQRAEWRPGRFMRCFWARPCLLAGRRP